MKIVRIQKVPASAEANYVTLTESRQLIDGYLELSEIHDAYKYELKNGLIRLKKETAITYHPK